MYRHLRSSVYTNTMFATIKSLQGNKCAKEQIKDFDTTLKTSLGNCAEALPLAPDDEDIDNEIEFDLYTDKDEINVPVPDADDIDFNAFHHFLSAQVSIPVGGELQRGKVIGRKPNPDGNIIGKSNPNPLLDTAIYEVRVEFKDGMIESYAANQIAEAVYAQVDSEGNQYLFIDEILDHWKMGDAVLGDDGLITRS
jgi:hypothetical protein